MTQKKKLRNSSMLKTKALASRDLPKKEDRRTGLLLFPRKLIGTSKCVQRTALRQNHSTPWGPRHGNVNKVHGNTAHLLSYPMSGEQNRVLL